jgi:hypothetical protein
MSRPRGSGATRFSRARKTSLRGHGSFVGGTSNDIPPPPVERGVIPVGGDSRIPGNITRRPGI